MIEDYILYLEKIQRHLVTYIAYCKRMGFSVPKCVESCLCKIQTVLPELRTLDESVADDLDYYQEMKIYVTHCLDQVDLASILNYTYFLYPLSNFVIFDVTDTSLEMTWTYTNKPSTVYSVEFSVDGIEYFPLAVVNVKSYRHENIISNRLYYYRVAAIEGGLYSGYVYNSARTLLSTPVAFTSTEITTDTINLRWADINIGETAHEISYSPDAVNYSVIATLGAETTSYEATGLAEGAVHFFRVRALNDVYLNHSGYATYNAITLLIAPTLLDIDNLTTGALTLTWTDNSSAEDNYIVQSSPDGLAPWTTLDDTLIPNTEAYAHTGLDQLTTFYYRVQASNLLSLSEYSNIVSSTTRLLAPSALVGTRMTFADFDLSWVSNSVSEETNFQLERSTDNTVWVAVETTGVNILEVSNDIPSVGDTYYYRVKALGATSLTDSDASNVESFVTVAAPLVLDPVVAGVTITDLSWVDTEGFVGTTQIQRREPNGANTWGTIVETTNTTYQDTGVTSGTEYDYRVLPLGATADYSNVENIVTQTLYDSAKFAFGLFRMNTNPLNTNVIQLRRDSDDTLAIVYLGDVTDFSFITLDNLVNVGGTLGDWIGGGDAYVYRWYDQSINEWAVNNGTLSGQPKFIEGGVILTKGGVPCVRFDVNDSLSDPLTIGAEFKSSHDFTVFTASSNVVQNTSGWVLQINSVLQNSNNNRVLFYRDGGVDGYSGFWYDQTGSSPTNPRYYMNAPRENTTDAVLGTWVNNGQALTVSVWDNYLVGSQDEGIGATQDVLVQTTLTVGSSPTSIEVQMMVGFDSIINNVAEIQADAITKLNIPTP